MVESINGHMTRYLEDMYRRRKNKRTMEFHGKSWKVEGKKEIVYIYSLLVTKQADSLASDFQVLCVFVCLVLFRFTNRLVILENSAYYLSHTLVTLFLSKFLVACSSPPTFRPKSRRELGHIFRREQSGDP